MKVIQRFGVWSVARTFAGIYGALGLVIGGFVALFSMMGAGIAALADSSADMPAWFAALFGVGAVVFFPILYGAIGLVGGAIVATVYNFVAARAGGIEVHLADAPPGGPMA